MMHITHLELLTNDLEATHAFYKSIPGLDVQDRGDDFVTFAAGSTLLTFKHTTITRPIYHFAFTIPANKLYEALDSLKEKTEILTLPDGNPIADFAHWNAGAFYFYDNNGNILEYIVRHSLDNAEALPFDSSRICCISEAGLVTDDVPALAGQLNRDYGLPLFTKQPPQDNFTVMGDDHGLLILVARHRHWFPTAVEAGVFPLKVTLRDEQDKEHRIDHGRP
ncbi:VOC family protein [Taibaiella helva]|uniref:VOC family protein n=1 Tax=Taibaiella helva TaxID=2301235 RepID=UPI000E58E48B|nr:VOC family protein [Taibaiella helva]